MIKIEKTGSKPGFLTFFVYSSTGRYDWQAAESTTLKYIVLRSFAEIFKKIEDMLFEKSQFTCFLTFCRFMGFLDEIQKIG